jgi:rhodanese-related sulfurtransferase
VKNVFSALLLLISLLGRSQDGNNQNANPDQFEKGIRAANIQVLDVRTSGEYMSGHIKNALLADWTNPEQFNDRIKYIDKDKPVYIYCQVGGRSAAAATWMRNNGYMQVVELQGGINAWKKAGKPLEDASHEKQMTMEEYLARIPADKTTLVDFGAPWCPPCVKMEPVIEETRNNKKISFQFIKIDAGVHINLMTALNIDPIPQFIIYKKGKEVWRKQGMVTKEEFLEHLR